MQKHRLSTHSLVFLGIAFGLNFSEPEPPRTAPTGGLGSEARLSNLPGGGVIGVEGVGSAASVVRVTVPVEGCEASPEASAAETALCRATGFGFALRLGGMLAGMLVVVFVGGGFAHCFAYTK